MSLDTAKDIATIVAACTAIVGVTIALYQFGLARKINRARLALDLNKLFADDVQERTFFYKLDYEDSDRAFVFDPKTFIHSEDERNLDSLLYKLTQVGYLIRCNIVKPEDIYWVRSIALSVLRNLQVHAYLRWLKKSYPLHTSFADLRALYRALFSHSDKTSTLLDEYCNEPARRLSGGSLGAAGSKTTAG